MLTQAEADAIVQYRQANGKFKSLDDLKKVPNVDASKLAAAAAKISFN
jgi:competence protein ComEA